MQEQSQNQAGRPNFDRVSATIESISKEVLRLKEEVQRQRDDSRNVIYAVVIASLLVFITIGVEVIIFHTR